MNAPVAVRTPYAHSEFLPERYTAEIVDGRLDVRPGPAARHIRIGSRLSDGVRRAGSITWRHGRTASIGAPSVTGGGGGADQRTVPRK